jgi:quinol monooxygenase YgiN
VVTVMAKLKIQPGKEAAFEGAAGELLAHVKLNEPGTLTYVLHRSTADPSEYVYYEVYTDQAALAVHGSSAAMQKFFGAIGGMVAGRPEITLYNEVAGKR